HEERALLGIEPRADPVGDVFVRVRRQSARIGEVARQRVPIGDEIKAVVLLLHRDPVVQGANEVSDMQAARRPHARHDANVLRRIHFVGSQETMKWYGGTTMRSKPPVSTSA